MLIEFRVSNYRSFNEEVVFSMVAAPRLRSHKENTVHSQEMKELGVPPLLKAAAIYGPNASGKSNLLSAMDALSSLVEGNEKTVFTQHRYDENAIEEPCRFSISFLSTHKTKLKIYDLTIWVCQKRVWKESLSCADNVTNELLYSRVYDKKTDKDHYVFGKALEGNKELHKLWESATPEKKLFLSQAVKNSSPKYTQLRSAHSWFEYRCRFSKSENEFLWDRATFLYLSSLSDKEANSELDKVAQFLSDIDIPVSKISIDKAALLLSALSSTPRNSKSVIFTHFINGKSYDFPLSDESTGTQNLFFISTPLLLSQRVGQILTFDELDSSLHPLIIKKLLEKQSSYLNDSQLIFTTHDTHLMDAKVLRRDQFWLMDRNREGASVLRSIYEYKGRESEDIEKRYYEGRYRALPIVF
jgi:AAA15 family ATPase/GTPase